MLTGLGDNWWDTGQRALFVALPYLAIGLAVALGALVLYVRRLKRSVDLLSFEAGTSSRSLRNANRELKTLFDQSRIAVFLLDKQSSSVLYANATALEAFGVRTPQEMTDNVLHNPDAWGPAPYSLLDFEKALAEASPAGMKSFEWRVGRSQDHEVWLDCSFSFLTYKSNRAIMFSGVNITARKRAEHQEKLHQQVMASMAGDRSLQETLERVVRVAEASMPGGRYVVMLRDSGQGRLRWGGGSLFPAAFRQALEDMPVRYGEGAPGTAAFTRTRVITENMLTDEHWHSRRQVLKEAGIQACWSEPIVGRGGEVLGTFDIYHDDPWLPSDEDVDALTGPIFLASLAIERHRSRLELEQMVVSEQAVRRISTELLTIEPDAVEEGLEGICASLGRYFRADRVFLCRVDDVSQELNLVNEWAVEGLPPLREQVINPLPVIPVSLDALLTVSRLQIFDGHNPLPPMLECFAEHLALGDSRSLLLKGVYQGDRLIGVLGMVKTAMAATWQPEHLANIRLMVQLLSNVLMRQKLVRTLTFQAVHDQLTGLYNRHKLESFMEQEVARCERYGSTFSVIIFDLDFFKSINDRFGHTGGDAVLEEVAAIVGGGIRESEIAGRWGGEEFLILLPETNLDSAHAVAERIRKGVETYRFTIPVDVTISVGVAVFQPGDKSQNMLQRADGALYVAKNEGRNCVRLAA
ncbi:diguanylate cyclase [Marinobacter salinexigens]|uniref:diguanylate cyclase n=1 Tax=Marinobacter salinexigens TaxID=2919747 RepID=A0A5B0VKB7_9GAMM|nr:diguanylate cyclase [Marinobacter salinexigens]KAA1174411.1 diguanylate cyclase [Marinobacter salinexigens]